MTKKIIAVSLVILLIAVSFAACGKDKGYLLAKDQDGNEHAYVTDAEGNTVLDENGDIRVYETDKNGEIATDKDGSKKENVVKMPEYIAKADKYETPSFYFTIADGWNKADEDGKYIKGENKDCFISISKSFSDVEEGENVLEATLVSTIEINAQVVEKAKKTYPDTTFNYGYEEVAGQTMYKLEYCFKDDAENVVLYSTSYYFYSDGAIYNIAYANVNGSEYDANFNFAEFVAANLKMK